MKIPKFSDAWPVQQTAYASTRINSAWWQSRVCEQLSHGCSAVAGLRPAIYWLLVRITQPASHAQHHLPISNHVLRDLQCLHPVARKDVLGRAAVAWLGQHLQKVYQTDMFVDKIDAEWLLSSRQDLLQKHWNNNLILFTVNLHRQHLVSQHSLATLPGPYERHWSWNSVRQW